MLALDLGNSALKAALFDGDAVTAARFPWADDWHSALAEWLDARPAPSATGLASVVPHRTAAVEQILETRGWPGPTHLHAHLPLPLRIGYATPETLGADRLAAALAAYTRYGRTRPVVVLDAGTALTYEVVDAGGTYLGGAIAPGAALLVRSLAEHTAQLPAVPFEAPASPIGDSTRAALQSGLVYGFLDGIDGMLTRLERALGQPPFVVATGGWGAFAARHIARIDAVRPLLVLEGIRDAVAWQATRA